MTDSVVDVIMVTYNQEQYIAQAIESVLMQKTDFTFRLIIGEDCSTDNTRNICINYAEKNPDSIVLILHETNQGLLKNYKSVFEYCTAKYLAILEGDDYWIDEFKLQKQVDVLEKNKDVGLVFTKIQKVNSHGERIKERESGPFNKDFNRRIFENILFGSIIPALTVCFRKNLMKEYIDLDEVVKQKFATLDYPIWIQLARITNFYYINEITATYRIHQNSISNTNDYNKKMEWLKDLKRISVFYCNKFGEYEKIKAVENFFVLRLTYHAITARNFSDIKGYRKQMKIDSMKSFLIWIGSFFPIVFVFVKNNWKKC